MNTSFLKDLKIIKISLVIISCVVVLYVLRLFSFIFIPLFLALFFSLLLLPILGWFNKKQLPNWIGIFVILLVIVFFLWISVMVFHNTAIELYRYKSEILMTTNQKINMFIDVIRGKLGLTPMYSGSFIDLEDLFTKNSTLILNKTSTFISAFFMTLFFLSLFLTGANLFETYIANISNDDKDWIQIFRDILDALNGFIRVKTFTSLLTGIIFTAIVMIFGVKFALFWGFMTFLLNFVQLIGSYFITALLILFGFVEIDSLPMLFVFSSLLILAQLIIGGVIEPILMGKNFKINTITILISLAIWGFIFGIAGLVLAIPITVFLKMVLARIPSTEYIAKMMSRVEIN